MAIERSVQGGIIQITTSGPHDPSDVRALLEGISQDAEALRARAIIADSRDTHMNTSVSELRELIEIFIRYRATMPSRGAIVVRPGLSYGLARMFAALARPVGYDFRVFIEIDKAHRWVGETSAFASSPPA